MIIRLGLLVVATAFCLASGMAQNVAINTTGAAPVASALLDVTSTSKGVLLPRMTAAQKAAIASPATGLLIYQTDGTEGYYYYDGASWTLLISASGVWATQGNASTDPTTDFLGTTDAQPIPIRTANTEKVTVTSDGKIGIKDPTPDEALSVGANSEFAVNSSGKVTSIDGGTVSPFTRTIYVDSAGKGDYTTLAAALAAITPTAVNRFQIILHPGDYRTDWANAVTLKSYVSIMGSGMSTIAGPFKGVGLVDVKISNLYYYVDVSGNTGAVSLNGSVQIESCEIYMDSYGANYYLLGGSMWIRNCIGLNKFRMVGDCNIDNSRFDDVVIEGSSYASAPFFNFCLVSGDVTGVNSVPVFRHSVILGTYNKPTAVTNTYNIYSSYIGSMVGDDDGADIINLYNCYTDDFNPPATNTTTFRFYGGIINNLTGSAGAYSVNLYSARIANPAGDLSAVSDQLSYGSIGLVAPATTIIPLTVRGAAGQTANIQEWQNSAGTAMSVITPAGNVGIQNNAPAYALDVGGDINVTGAFRKSGSAGVSGQLLGSDGAAMSWFEVPPPLGAPYWETGGNAGTAPGVDFVGTTDAQDLVFKANATEVMRLKTDGKLGIGTSAPAATLHVNGNITSPGNASGTASEKYGSGSTVHRTNSLSIGVNAIQDSVPAGDFRQLSVGNAATTFSQHGYVVGNSTSSTGIRGGIIGNNAANTGNDNFVIGNSTASISNSMLVGHAASATGTECVAIGRGATTASSAAAFGRSAAAPSQWMVAGSSLYPINDVYFGKGITDAAPTTVTLHTTSGSGANITGSNMTLAGGRGTGAGVGGSVILKTASAGASGAALNLLSNRLEVYYNGFVGIATVAAPKCSLQVNTSIAYTLTNVTTAYTVTANDHSVLADATSGAYAVTLPTASGITGRIYMIKKTDVSANAVTVACAGAETIEGSATVALNAQYDYVLLQSDGTNWIKIN